VSNNTKWQHYIFNGQLVMWRQTTSQGSSTTRFLLTDHLGGTTTTLGNTGLLTGDARYGPWGNERYTNGTLSTEYHYTGQREDATLGIYDYNARYYDPAIGRFLSADTIVPDPTDPQNYNRYSYTINNPLKYTDPTGHQFTICEENFENCNLPNGLDPNSSWTLPNGKGYSLVDPNIPKEYTPTGELLVGGILVIGAAAAPTVVGYVAGEIVWPTLVKVGQGIATWLCGDLNCTNEIEAIQYIPQRAIDFLANQANRVNHIMQVRHGWDRLVPLTGNAAQDYQAIQPYIQMTVDLGNRVAVPGAPANVSQYTLLINGQQVVVRGIELANGAFQIADAWVVIP
jgi:RHS repeat-associated protein